MHDTSTYYTTYFFLNFPEKCTYYKNGVEYMLNDGHGIFGVIFFFAACWVNLSLLPLFAKKGIIAP